MAEDKKIVPRPGNLANNVLELFFEGKSFRAFKNSSGSRIFAASDVCNILGIKNVSDALERLDEDEKDDIVSTDVMGRRQEIRAVTESGLYSLILSSRKAEAKAFKRWITHEVIPALEKAGVYSLRSTERQSYKDVRDCFAQASDYDPSNPACQFFFANVQNKIHFAVTGQTAAEIIVDRANHQQPKMGLIQLDNDNVHKADVVIAKNYLSDDELSLEDSLDKSLYILVNVLAKQIEGGRSATTTEFVQCVDMHILSFRMDLLTSRGNISMKQAKKIAEQEYTRFKKLIQGGQ